MLHRRGKGRDGSHEATDMQHAVRQQEWEEANPSLVQLAHRRELIPEL